MLPMATMPAMMGMIFYYYFTKDGLVNYFLQFLIPGFAPNWVFDPQYVLLAAILLTIWEGTPFLMIIFLSWLQSLPSELYEQASIDGAGIFQKFRYITLPLLQPAIAYNIMVATISNLQAFDAPYVLGQGTGGPGFGTTTLAIDVYFTGFVDLRFGLCCAKAVIILILSWIVVLLLWRRVRGLYAIQ